MSINDAEHTISALREAMNTLAEHTISALREALNALIDSHEQLLSAMTDHGACEDGFEDDIAALAAARIVAIAARGAPAQQEAPARKRCGIRDLEDPMDTCSAPLPCLEHPARTEPRDV